MTSEPDSASQRRPPTIDLTATEVEPEEQPSARESGASRQASEGGGGNSSGVRQHVQGAAIGVIVMAAIFAALWFAGYLPSHEPAARSGEQETRPSAIDQISARLDKIQGTLQAQQPDPALVARIASAEAATKSLGDTVAALNRRADEIATAAQTALAQAKAAASAADRATSAAQTGMQRSDLDALTARVAALENAVKAISANTATRSPSADDRAARLTIAAESLRAAVERGSPYQAELAAVKSLGVGPDATAPLDRFAADGVPTASALAQDIATLTPALLGTAGNAPVDGGYLQRLKNSAQRLVRITPIDAPSGDQAAAVVARINADAAHADIAGALAEIARLPAAAKTLAASWVDKAEARDAAIAASRRIAAAALAALAKPNPS